MPISTMKIVNVRTKTISGREERSMVMSRSNVVSLLPSSQISQQTWTEAEQKILDVLQIEENRRLSVTALCQKAGVGSYRWYKALKKPQFVAVVEDLGVAIERHEKQ